MVNFSKFCSESLHVDTDIDVVVFKFREIWPTGNRRNRALLTDKKNKISAASQTVATGPAPNNVLIVLQISSKSVHISAELWLNA